MRIKLDLTDSFSNRSLMPFTAAALSDLREAASCSGEKRQLRYWVDDSYIGRLWGGGGVSLVSALSFAASVAIAKSSRRVNKRQTSA
jgi:hypothetical protein